MKKIDYVLVSLLFSNIAFADAEMKYLDRTLICKTLAKHKDIEDCYDRYLTTGVESRTIKRWTVYAVTDLFDDSNGILARISPSKITTTERKAEDRSLSLREIRALMDFEDSNAFARKEAWDLVVSCNRGGTRLNSSLGV